MANVLGTLFSDIAGAIRAKTGETGTMKPAEFPERIAAIETGATEEILHDLPVTLDFSDGATSQTLTAPDGTLIRSAVIEKPDTLTPENIAQGIDIAGIVGTLVAGGGSDALLPTTEMAFAPNPDYGNMWMSSPALCTLEAGKRYTVTWDGTDYICAATDLSIFIPGMVGLGNLAFVGGANTGEPFAFAYDAGSVIDGVRFDSNICLTGDTNTHYMKIVKAPKTMTVKTGVFRASASPTTVPHEMGVIPDMIIVWINSPLENLCVDMAVGFSNAMYEAFGNGSWSFLRNGMNVGGAMYVGTVNFSTGFEGTEGNMQGAIREVNDWTFKIGGDTGMYKLITTADYNWMAISGITG